MIILLDLFNK